MHIISLIQKSSLIRTLYFNSLTLITKTIDRILNIDTISLPEKVINYKTHFDDSKIYEGYSYFQLWKCLRLLKLSHDDVVFDVGCGMGQILCVFARRFIRKCIGIEISTELAEKASRNAERLKGRKAPIEIFVADAAEADYSEGTVYCLFNPFGTKTLRAVIELIHQSVRKCPRRIRVVYFNAAHENVMESCGWLRCYSHQENILTKRWGKVSLWTNMNSII